ncbi:MAG: twin-arginine translocation pathway signal protein [Paracoccaceae bacterium]|nr:twin-arginine translocation pathway signal protein [Paracoccaceae bacterium]
MALTRRQTLSILGGGAILAAGGVGYSVTRMPQTAQSPWAAAGAYADPRKNALSYAVLAPNPHNRQPWLVDLATPGEVTLYVDTERLLPHTDPFSRQIVIGLGCFLETMSIAANAAGYGVEIEVFPEGGDPRALDGRPVAHARFSPGAGVPEPQMFEAIPHRRSVKEPYDTARTVPEAALATLRAAGAAGSAIATTGETGAVAALRDITARAFQIEFETPRTYKESVDLFRIGHREVDASPDGIDFTGPTFESLRLARLFTREGALDTGSIAYRSGIDMVTANSMTGMAYVWQVTETNTRADQIAAGRDWMRIHLAATAEGLSVQPMSQALQEFPEMAGPYGEVHAMLAPGGGTVQMLGRLGYGPEVGAAPRWPLEAKIRGDEPGA